MSRGLALCVEPPRKRLVASVGKMHMRVIVVALLASLAIEGTVERYEWANPHVYIHLRSSSGAWLVEVGSPSIMQRVGWQADGLAAGDVVAVDVNPLATPSGA